MAWLAMMGLRRVPGLLDGMKRNRLLLRPTCAYPEVASLEAAAALPHNHFVHGHVPADVPLPAGVKVVTILRHPRNVLVSYARWRGLDDPAVGLRGGFCRRRFVAVYRRFLGWRGRALVLRYEDMPRMFTAGAPDLYADAEEDHDTMMAVPSDWRDVWSPEMDAAWRQAGGPQLERDAGYA